MKLGGLMTAFFMIAGIIIFGIGLYIVSAKDEDVIDRVVEEMKSLRQDLEDSRVAADKEKKTAEQFRTEILLTAAKIDQFIESQGRTPKKAARSDVAVSGPVLVRFEKPVQIEVISRKPVAKAVKKRVKK